MSNKSSTSSSNNHFHYHLYQYQTHNCCFNLLDPSKTSSTVTTAASNENFPGFHTQSIGNTCQSSDFMQSRNTQNADEEKMKENFMENPSQVTSSGSEFPSTVFNNHTESNLNATNCGETTNLQTPASENAGKTFSESSSKPQTTEKIVEIEFSSDNYRQPDEDCSCTQKFVPYKINEKNVWQVYETSDCKYIQSKYEVDEIFHVPPSREGDKYSSVYNPLLHSRSNFSKQIICHSTSNNENSRKFEKKSSGGDNEKYSAASTKYEKESLNEKHENSEKLYGNAPDKNINPGNDSRLPYNYSETTEKFSNNPENNSHTPYNYSETTDKFSNNPENNSRIPYNYSETTEKFCKSTPNYSEITINYTKTSPNYSETSRKYNRTSPNNSEIAHTFNNSTPNHRETPEKYRTLSPSYVNNEEKTCGKDSKLCYNQSDNNSESINSATPLKLNSTADSLYTPSFNIKSETQEICHCINEETEDTESKVEDDDESVITKIKYTPPKNRKISHEVFSGKLLNRPKATNNICRDQVKPVEKEVQNEITRSGGKLSMKTSKLVKLPNPSPKLQFSPKRCKSYDNESTNDDDFSSIASQNESGRENKNSPKTNVNQQNLKSTECAREQSSLVRQESKNISIPNIHQGEFQFEF